jgi:Domain of unknown function (DUF4326)
MMEFLLSDANLTEIIRDLRGKNLACFCPLDQPCHGAWLLHISNEPNVWVMHVEAKRKSTLQQDDPEASSAYRARRAELLAVRTAVFYETGPQAEHRPCDPKV